MPRVRNFIVVGRYWRLVVQVLLAIHVCTDARCAVICARGTRFLRWTNLVAEYMEADLSGEDDDRFVDMVNRLAAAMPGVTLIPADCEGARMTDRVRKRLMAQVISAPDASMLDLFDNKWRFYQFCKEHRLNAPSTRFIASKYDLDFASTALELGLPFVLKPLSQLASQGVHIVAGKGDYLHAILNNAAYQYAPLIAQRYIQGTDVSLNLLSKKGRVAALAIQQRCHPQHPGARVRFISNDSLESVAHTLSSKSGYDGVMKIDARVEDGTGKVFLFESNARFWRSLSASVWCGLNFVAESMKPSLQPDKIAMLTSGCADTYYHPLFRPSLWRHALFDNDGHRGQMVRIMMIDMCTLASQTKAMLKAGIARGRPLAVLAPRRAGA
jgi:predicted ATP-grasp superfamily ATP-dependent carboligase